MVNLSFTAICRDLKPHNLLMDPKTLTLKIADLGLARAYTLPIKKYTHEVVYASSLSLTALDFKLLCCTSSEVVESILTHM